MTNMATPAHLFSFPSDCTCLEKLRPLKTCTLIFFFPFICIKLKYVKSSQALTYKKPRAEKSRAEDFLLSVLYLLSIEGHLSPCPVFKRI